MEKNFFFKPWIGKNYGQYSFDGRSGLKLLILGESHYLGKEAENKDNKNFTKLVISKHLNEKGIPFFTKLYNLLNNSDLDQNEFWGSVAFYDFVQTWIDEPRVAPTEEQFLNSIPLFYKILRELSPDIVICTGKRLWFNTPDDSYTFTKKAEVGREFFQGYYTVDGKKIMATFIIHPSSSAFSYAENRDHIAQFMNESFVQLI